MSSSRLARHSLKTSITFATLIIFVAGIWSLAFYTSRMLREDVEKMLGEQQFSTVSNVATHINDELQSRLNALEKVAAMIDPAILGNPVVLQSFLEQRLILQSEFNGGAFVTQANGVVSASFPYAGQRGIDLQDRDYIAAVLKHGKSAIGRPVISKKLQLPVFVMAVGVRDTHGNVIGALAGAIDLSKPSFLDSIVSSRYGKSGGYLLVAPQHRLIVTASDKSRVMETLPAAGVNPVLDRFIQGHEGTAVFTNPVGVEVLASVKSIPVAGWYVATILPTAEAFSPINDMQQRMLIAAIFLTLLAGSLTWWMLRRQLAPMLSTVETLTRLSKSSQPPPPLVVTRQDEMAT